MQLNVSSPVTYHLNRLADVNDVILALQAHDRLIHEATSLLARLDPHLEIRIYSLHISQISQNSPLHQLFIAGLAIGYQKDLSRNIPAYITELTGYEVPERLTLIVTLLVILLALEGSALAASIVESGVKSFLIEKRINRAVEHLSEELGVEKGRVEKALRSCFRGKNFTALVKKSVAFFAPAKRSQSSDIELYGGQRIKKDVVREVPYYKDVVDIENDVEFEVINDAVIELTAQNKVRSKTGWAGIIRAGDVDWDKPIRIRFPNSIDPSGIYLREEIRADLYLIKKRNKDGSFSPYIIDIVKLVE